MTELGAHPRARIIGPGRAGSAFAAALAQVGWRVEGPLGPSDDLAEAAADVDLVLIATPDGVIADAAAAIEPVASTVVAHVSGATGLEPLAQHPQRASVHPLQAIPRGPAGAERLLSGGWFAVAGSPLVTRLVHDLGGRFVQVDDGQRARYHAVASIASNHLVALLGQVERLAATIDVPFEAYLDLAVGALESVAATSPGETLTGPAARNDRATLAAHIASLPIDERAAYVALMRQAERLAADQLGDRADP